MIKLRRSLFLLVFIIFPLILGIYSISTVEKDVYFGARLATISEATEIEAIAINSQDLRSNLVYNPIENTLNFGEMDKKKLNLSTNALQAVEYDLKTGVEKILDPLSLFSTSFQSIIEPFGGIVDSSYFVEGFVEEEESGLKPAHVFPPDDRQKITSVTEYPWRTITKIFIRTQEENYYVSSGAIIDDFHVLTCGHCVYVHDEGGWAAEVIVIPGKDGSYEPYGRAHATNLRSFTGWTDFELAEHDMALITLDRSIGNLTGWMGMQTDVQSSSIYTGTLNLAGYPGELDSGLSMYFDSDTGDRASLYNHWYWMDMTSGQSGSPVWREDAGNRYILSINAYEFVGGLDANMGTRLNTNKFNQINSWLAADNTPVVGDKPDLLDRGIGSGVSASEVIKEETTLEIYADVKNEGTIAASTFKVGFYLSENTAISSFDYSIGNVTINSLDPFNYTSADWTGVIPADIPAARYYVGWIIDSEQNIDEFNENNNNVLLGSTQIIVRSPLPGSVIVVITVFVVIGLVALISIAAIIASRRTKKGKLVESLSYANSQHSYVPSYSELQRQIEQRGFKFCPSCGHKRSLRAKYCMYCGYRLKAY